MALRVMVAGLFGVGSMWLAGSAALAQGGAVQPAAVVPPAVAIKVPTDPVEKAAFDMLEKHCSRCHQEGKLGQKLKPAGRFGNTMMMGEIAVDAQRVVPGNPDASLIFSVIAEGKMPYDIFQDPGATNAPPPTEEELQALRAWITGLGKTAAASCESRKFVKHNDIVAAIAADLERQPDHRVKGMRYLTLTHLYNACTEDQLMEGYRQAAVKLLNSLSSQTDVVRLETIDPEKTIVKFNITDLGWSEQDWNTLLAAYPYGSKPAGNLFNFLTQATGTKLPYMRADWFAQKASSPPLYNVLLKLPVTAQELEKKLGLDTLENIKNLRAQRSGFQRSGVSANNRLIERHTISSGYFWTSYDFAGNRDRQSLFKFPLGPHGEAGFDHDGGESLFSLPNGFNGYYLSDSTGKQLSTGPTAIVRDPSRRDLAVTNGISCFGCHDQGIRIAQDDVRKVALDDKGFSREVREKVAALYPPVEEMRKVLDGDQARFRNAMIKAGIDPGLKPHGIEMINALAQKYDDMLDLRRTAAEFGMRPDEFSRAAGGAGPAALSIARRVEQGLLARDTFEHDYPGLVALINDEDPIKGDAALAVQPPAQGAAGAKVDVAGVKGFDLVLVAEKSTYNQNDAAVLTVTSKKDCNLTLINVDGSGDATIIFPNKFQIDNKVVADKAFTFGGDKAPFRFRLADKGVETVIAECNASKTASRGLEATYRDNGFTSLGDYGKQVTRQIAEQAKERASFRKIVVDPVTGGAAGGAAAGGAAAGAAPGGVVKGATGIPGAVASAAPIDTDKVARTAIKITVR